MKKILMMNKLTIAIMCISLCFSCVPTKNNNVKDSNLNDDGRETTLTHLSPDVFIFGQIDTTLTVDLFDNSANGVFGRKIVYRDLTATKSAVNTSGKMVFKVCINNAGLVTYAELITSETTISEKRTLRAYLKAASGYKFQPDSLAPVQQCGKLRLIVDNSANIKLRKQ